MYIELSHWFLWIKIYQLLFKICCLYTETYTVIMIQKKLISTITYKTSDNSQMKSRVHKQ